MANFATVFESYYTQYLGDYDIPAVGDPEWKTAIVYCNSAIRKWAGTDGVLWNALFSNSVDGGGDTSYINSTTGTSQYALPTNFKHFSSDILIGDATNPTQRVMLISPETTNDYKSTSLPYAYITGSANPSTPYTLNIHVNNGALADGLTISYDYYREPKLLTQNETGSTTLDVPDSEYLVQEMLAAGFRASRNWTAVQDCRTASNQLLANMVTRNTMGTPASPWNVQDASSGFGVSMSGWGGGFGS